MAENGKNGSRYGEGYGNDGQATSTVLQLVVSGVHAFMGFRSEKGFVMEGSVDAVTAQGEGGITFLSINPATLWGWGEDHADRGLEAETCAATSFVRPPGNSRAGVSRTVAPNRRVLTHTNLKGHFILLYSKKYTILVYPHAPLRFVMRSFLLRCGVQHIHGRPS